MQSHLWRNMKTARVTIVLPDRFEGQMIIQVALPGPPQLFLVASGRKLRVVGSKDTGILVDVVQDGGEALTVDPNGSCVIHRSRGQRLGGKFL